ncbi:hypothetical protein [Pseudomonas sp. S2_H01]
MTDRLASSNPDLYRAFDAMEPSTKKQVATRIVLWAIDEVGGDSNEVAELLSREGHARLAALCAEMEEKYFDLLERDEHQSCAWFCKARAYNASVLLAREELDDAVYESIFATEKPIQVSDFL